MAEPLDNRAKVADEIDLVRRLVEMTGMAAADFLQRNPNVMKL